MTHTINTAGTVAVATDVYLQPVGQDTPRGVKLQLLTQGGVLVYGHYDGKDKFYTDWAPLPKKREKME